MTTCRTCPTVLGPKNKSGLCRSCFTRQQNADPKHKAARLAGIRREVSTPQGRERRAANARRLNATYWARPENAVRRVEHGKRVYREILSRPDVRAKNAAAVAIAARKRRADEFAWCPPEYREEYREMVRSKKLPAVEARAAIMQQVFVDRARANGTSVAHEQRLARVAAGEVGITTAVYVPFRPSSDVVREMERAKSEARA